MARAPRNANGNSQKRARPGTGATGSHAPRKRFGQHFLTDGAIIGAIIDAIHAARPAGARPQDGIVINPGGYTHTSVAIHDALRAVPVPAIEVHLSNIYRRETFRHASVTGVACAGVIMGLGTASYLLALRHLADTLRGATATPVVPTTSPTPNFTPRDPARPSP